MSTSLPSPFRATVDQNFITKASCFFDNTLKGILRELLQNSRRSGATAVDIKTTSTRWSYTDDGPGCMPSDLLGLGSSSWSQSVRDSESPAGCGFFSLARREPSVTCPKRGWSIDLTEAQFNGAELVTPQIYESEVQDFGLRIDFDVTSRETSRETDTQWLNDFVRYFQLDITVDGKTLTTKLDFMAPSGITGPLVKFSDSISYRVMLTRSILAGSAVNYNGHVVNLPELRSQTGMMFGVNGGAFYGSGRIEVTDEGALPLELPQRNQIIEGHQLFELRKALRLAVLELAAVELKDTYVGSPAAWLDAQTLYGYTGPVLYSRYVGQLMKRNPDFDLYDHALSCDGYIASYAATKDLYSDSGRYVTREEFEDDKRYKIYVEHIEALAATEFPVDPDEFIPGVLLVRRLKWTQASYDLPKYGAWGEELRDFYAAATDWCDEAVLVRTDTDGNESEEELDYPYDTDNVYSALRLEFRSSTSGVVAAPVRALFGLYGDSNDETVDFVVTQGWLDELEASALRDIGSVACRMRDLYDRGDGEGDPCVNLLDDLELTIAKLRGGDHALTLRLERIREASRDAVSGFGYAWRTRIRQLIVTHDFEGQKDTHIQVVPVFNYLYRVSGTSGTVRFDAEGNREPENIVYPELLSLDVASAAQALPGRFDFDILDVGGWHDRDRKIYVEPNFRHLLWSMGLLSDPIAPTADFELAEALRQAVETKRLSSAYFTAILPQVIEQIPLVLDTVLDAPETSNFWLYADRKGN